MGKPAAPLADGERIRLITCLSTRLTAGLWITVDGLQARRQEGPTHRAQQQGAKMYEDNVYSKEALNSDTHTQQTQHQIREVLFVTSTQDEDGDDANTMIRQSEGGRHDDEEDG